MARRNRGFTFTWYEFPGATIESLQQRSLDTEGAKYVIAGREVCPTTGRQHIQGYIYFTDKKSLASVRVLFPRAHIECAFTITEAIEYCKKEGNYLEFGDPHRSKEERGCRKERWDNAWRDAKSGSLESIPADIRIRQYSQLLKIARDYQNKPSALPGVCGLWVFGLSGAGKSTSVHSQYPEAYLKNASKWWDGYQGKKPLSSTTSIPTMPHGLEDILRFGPTHSLFWPKVREVLDTYAQHCLSLHPSIKSMRSLPTEKLGRRYCDAIRSLRKLKDI